MLVVWALLLSFADAPAEALIATARDRSKPAAERAGALVAYGRSAKGPEAPRAIWALRGAIAGAEDPVYEALAEVGPPALSLLPPMLRACRVPGGKGGDDMLALSTLTAIATGAPRAPAARALVAPLARALGCPDGAWRSLAARTLAQLAPLDGREVAAVRARLRGGPPHGRALAASILGEVRADDPLTVQALERALGDRAALVQVAAGGALMKVGRPDRARPVLERLANGADPTVAPLARQALR